MAVQSIYKSSDGYLFNMDSVELFRTMSENSIDLIVTDPPYPTTSRGNAGTSGGMLQKEINKKGKVFIYNDIDIRTYAPECFRVLKDGSHFYIMTNHVNLINMLNVCTESGFHFIKSIIWDKGNKIMGQYYMSQFEYILFFRKGKGVKINNCGTPDILSIPNKKLKDKDGKNFHDTEKPVDLMKILIENSTKPNQIVFDPFMGIGSVALACKESGRKFICNDLDIDFCNIAIKRLNGEI